MENPGSTDERHAGFEDECVGLDKARDAGCVRVLSVRRAVLERRAALVDESRATAGSALRWLLRSVVPTVTESLVQLAAARPGDPVEALSALLAQKAGEMRAKRQAAAMAATQ